jgi:hypothetical protein
MEKHRLKMLKKSVLSKISGFKIREIACGCDGARNAKKIYSTKPTPKRTYGENHG